MNLSYEDIYENLKGTIPPKPEYLFAYVQEPYSFLLSPKWNDCVSRLATLGYLSHIQTIFEKVTDEKEKAELITIAFEKSLIAKQYHCTVFLMENYSDTEITSTFFSKNKDFKVFYEFQPPRTLKNHEKFIGLEEFSNQTVKGFKTLEYTAIRDILLREELDIRSVNQLAFKANLLFGGSERLLLFMKKWGHEIHETSRRPLTDLLDSATSDFPIDGSIHYRKWGDAFLKYGPKIRSSFGHAGKELSSPPTSSSGKLSLLSIEEGTKAYMSRHYAQCRDLLSLSFALNTRLPHFQLAHDLWQYSRDIEEPIEMADTIPDISFDGACFGLPGYFFTKMSYDDVRMLFLGEFTGCCEKIGGAYSDTIAHALSTRESGFYIITDHNGDIKAHSWVWRSPQGDMVIDGFESEDPYISDQNIAHVIGNICIALQKENLFEEYEISRIIGGVAGNHFTYNLYYEPIADEDKVANLSNESIPFTWEYLGTKEMGQNFEQYLIADFEKYPDDFLKPEDMPIDFAP